MEEQKLDEDNLKFMKLLERVREELRVEESAKYSIPILVPSPEAKPEGTRVDDSKIERKEKLKGKGKKTKLAKGTSTNRLQIKELEQEQAYRSWTLDLPIVLEDGNRVSLRFDRRDLYLLGYQKSDGTYYQFNDSRLQDAHGVDLNFQSNYTVLAAASRCPHTKLSLGFFDLRDAVQCLATTKVVPKLDQREIALSLFVTAQMLCESSRFKLIAQEVAGDNARWLCNKKLPESLIEIQKKWFDISVYLQRPDILAKRPSHKLPRGFAIDELGITTLEDLAGAMGILKKRKEDKKETSYSPCSCCSDTEKDE